MRCPDYTKTMRISWLTLMLLGGLGFQPAFADPPDDQTPHREHHKKPENGRLSSNEAARVAQKQQGGGRVLSVDATEGGYRVKLLQKGDVHIVFVPERQ